MNPDITGVKTKPVSQYGSENEARISGGMIVVVTPTSLIPWTVDEGFHFFARMP